MKVIIKKERKTISIYYVNSLCINISNANIILPGSFSFEISKNINLGKKKSLLEIYFIVLKKLYSSGNYTMIDSMCYKKISKK